MDQSDTSQHCARRSLPLYPDGLSAINYAGICAFVAVASEGSYTKAAELLGLDRLSISRNVKRLEAQMNLRLFEKTVRATELTREGQRFFEDCCRGVALIVEAMNDMLLLRQRQQSGRLPSGADVQLR
ncbi:LysR family transcriptional regulator [Burkholderia pseudomallei]|uniref:LysR family transcriptional regulator n=1 Tax=Burkholderia pseudomallei TaxID=28450 RepID=UPI00194031D2|nr:LysR family transcriptional regulator [Burkholderia pseudomallei]